MSAFLLPFGFGVDEFLYFIFYIFFNKTKITKILTRKSDLIFCCPKIFYFLYFFVFRLEKHAVVCSGRMKGVTIKGGKGKRLFFASFKQLFFCFLYVCKKKRKRVDLDEVRDCFKDYTRRERKEELWYGLLRTLFLPYVIRFFFVFSQCFFFFFWSFLSSFPPFFFWFLISFPFVCVSFVCVSFVCVSFICVSFVHHPKPLFVTLVFIIFIFPFLGIMMDEV